MPILLTNQKASIRRDLAQWFRICIAFSFQLWDRQHFDSRRGPRISLACGEALIEMAKTDGVDLKEVL